MTQQQIDDVKVDSKEMADQAKRLLLVCMRRGDTTGMRKWAKAMRYWRMCSWVERDPSRDYPEFPF
jgi:hypothetical protein